MNFATVSILDVSFPADRVYSVDTLRLEVHYGAQFICCSR